MQRIHRSIGLWVALLLITVVLVSCTGPTTAAPIAVPTSPAVAAEPTSAPAPTQEPEPTAVPAPTATSAPADTPVPEAAPADISADDVVRLPMDDLKALVDQGADIIIFDNRPAADYRSGHIKGASSLPWDMELKEAAVADLSKDKPVVTYCDCGPGEADSADMAAKLIRAGFKDVKTLANGWTEWFEAGYPTE